MHCSVKQPSVTPAAAISRAIASIWSVLERTAPTVGLGLAKAIWISLMAHILPDPRTRGNRRLAPAAPAHHLFCRESFSGTLFPRSARCQARGSFAVEL